MVLSQSSFYTKHQGKEKKRQTLIPRERERVVELEFIAIHEPIKSGRLSIGLVPTANLDMCSLFTWIYPRCATRFGSVDHITTFLSLVRDSIFQLADDAVPRGTYFRHFHGKESKDLPSDRHVIACNILIPLRFTSHPFPPLCFRGICAQWLDWNVSMETKRRGKELGRWKPSWLPSCLHHEEDGYLRF